MRIALVYPPCSELNLKGYPLGLAYLSASLRKTHQVDVYDYNGKEYKKSIKAFLDSIKEKKPDLVGISFTSFNRGGAYELLRNIKKINKDIMVVLGGVHPSTLYGQVFEYFYNDIDFIIQSEGERPLRDLCHSLETKGNFAAVSGLVYKDSRGSFIANPVNDVVKDLDELPMPDLSFAAGEIKKKETAYLITSRGCPVNCCFCSTSTFWGQNVRMNSPERVGREVEYAKSLGAKRIFFHDDTFNLGIERTLKLADTLKRLNIEYAISCRVKPVSEEMIAKLAESGCRHISWGVESLSEKILTRIDKKISPGEVKKAFDLCAGYADKMTTSAFCCVGIPGETEETIDETAQYMNRNIKSTHGPGASILYILPGTRIYKDLVSQGKINERLWIESAAVYYYTREQSIFTLNRWRKKINQSGIRIPFQGTYFWDVIPADDGNKEPAVIKRLRRIRRKTQRFFNMVRNRY
jgi:radical SAM superfamily enzyme YgiQ (UPF0313 family)